MNKSNGCNFWTSLLKWFGHYSPFFFSHSSDWNRNSYRASFNFGTWRQHHMAWWTRAKEPGSLHDYMQLGHPPALNQLTSFVWTILCTLGLCYLSFSLHPNTNFHLSVWNRKVTWFMFPRDPSSFHVDTVLGWNSGCSKTRGHLRDHCSNWN